MNHALILPVLIPALTAALLLLVHRAGLALQRVISVSATLALTAVALLLLHRADDGMLRVYTLGNWVAPFGIVLVLDRMSAMMLALTAVVALASLWSALREWDGRGLHFHSLFQFQLMGINGAFLTGDLFNLFVFFEVLLIASYGLLLHGGGVERARAGVHYVVINLAGSSLFLVAVALLYGVTGTLNMADLAVKVAQVDESGAPLARVAALLLLAVFGVKAALFPLYFWLPGSYAAASAPVAALFAIMTKVGVYCILRVFPLVFGSGAGLLASAAASWVLPLGLATLVLGTLGVLAGDSLRRMVAYLTITSVGTLLAAVGLFSQAAIGAALYYMVHSTLVAAALFLLCEPLARQRGDCADRLQRGPDVAQPVLLATAFWLLAATAAGLPPFSGFLGKLMILEAAQDSPWMAWFWASVLITGLLTVYAAARAGSTLFWSVLRDVPEPAPAPAPVAAFAPLALLGALLLSLTLAAEPLTAYASRASTQLLDGSGYVNGVLDPMRALFQEKPR